MIWIWISFIAFVLALLALDLGVFHRKAHVVRIREALGWSAVWIALGISFSVVVYFAYENHWLGIGSAIDAVDGQINYGRTAVLKYLTGYVIEKSLSVDNIFVIALIFAYFKVPAMYQHRLLFWGILGALVMRGAMIGAAAELITRFHFILYIFGGFLVITGIRMLRLNTDHAEPRDNPIVRLTRRIFPVTEDFHGQHFMIHQSGKWHLTPMALTLVMVETTDLIFAVDSIPAIFAITADPFLVFTSNVFAILGLRSLYFALAGAMDKFRYLKFSLAIVLAVVGMKMLLAGWLKQLIGEHFNLWLLAAIFTILGAGVIASMIANRADAGSRAAA